MHLPPSEFYSLGSRLKINNPRNGFYNYLLQAGSNLASNFQNLSLSHRGAHIVEFKFSHFIQEENESQNS